MRNDATPAGMVMMKMQATMPAAMYPRANQMPPKMSQMRLSRRFMAPSVFTRATSGAPMGHPL